MFDEGPKFVEFTPEFEKLERKAGNYALLAFLPVVGIPTAICELIWGEVTGSFGLLFGLTIHGLAVVPIIMKSVCKIMPKNYWIGYYCVFGSLFAFLWVFPLAASIAKH